MPSVLPSDPLDILDLAELRERAGHDEELVCELLGDFLDRAGEIVTLNEAASAGDYTKVSRLAHRLKGSLLALGAKAAARAASTVEHQATARAADPGAAATDPTPLLTASLAALTVRHQEACCAMRAAREPVTTMATSTSSGWR